MKQARAVYAFSARSENEISFNAGDLIFILEEDLTSGWSKGRTQDYMEGYFPHNYVEIEDLADSDADSDSDDGIKSNIFFKCAGLIIYIDTNKSVLQCLAIYDFNALSDTQISFKKGNSQPH